MKNKQVAMLSRRNWLPQQDRTVSLVRLNFYLRGLNKTEIKAENELVGPQMGNRWTMWRTVIGVFPDYYVPNEPRQKTTCLEAFNMIDYFKRNELSSSRTQRR